MHIRDLIPPGLRSYVALLHQRARYPGRLLFTANIHKTVRLGRPCRLAPGVCVGADVCIGDYSYINDHTFVGSGTIGRFCSIGCFCSIGMHEHPLDHVSTSPFLYGARNLFGKAPTWDDFREPPSIGNDVWIASGATVLQGARISDGAVVAAGAVVTKDVPPYAIVAGVPARIIRYRFSERDIEALLSLQWWNMSPAELCAHEHLLRCGKDWVNKLPPIPFPKERAAA